MFAFNADISQWELMQFAEAASEGQDSATLEGLASLSRFAKELIAPEDVYDGEGEDRTLVGYGRKRFAASARRNRATGDDLLRIINTAFGVEAERPTERPSDSTGGPSNTPPKSVSNSTDKVVAMYPHRPDLQLVAKEQLSA